MQALDEIQAGMFDGWTYEEIAEKHSEEYAARKRDKLRYRQAPLLHLLFCSCLQGSFSDSYWAVNETSARMYPSVAFEGVTRVATIRLPGLPLNDHILCHTKQVP